MLLILLRSKVGEVVDGHLGHAPQAASAPSWFRSWIKADTVDPVCRECVPVLSPTGGSLDILVESLRLWEEAPPGRLTGNQSPRRKQAEHGSVYPSNRAKNRLSADGGGVLYKWNLRETMMLVSPVTW